MIEMYLCGDSLQLPEVTQMVETVMQMLLNCWKRSQY